MTIPEDIPINYVDDNVDGLKDLEGKLWCEHGDISKLSSPALYILYSLSNIWRKKFNKRLHINSGYRCPECNKAIGGALNSAHIRGIAFDVHYDNDSELFVILKHMLSNGISVTRMGIGKTYVHFDIGSDKDGYKQEITWLYV